MMDALTIFPPARPLRGRVSPPGAKCITNRALLLAALARGTSRLTGVLKSDDTNYMADALRVMAVSVEEPDATSFVVTTTTTGRLRAPAGPLFLANAGTATRFLTAAAALADGPVVITGDAHMQRRPIAPLVAALQSLGVVVDPPTGCPPVTVRGQGDFDGDAVTLDAGLSSQYVSALLMLAAGGRQPLKVVLKGDAIGARGYIDLTWAVMRCFGAKLEQLDTATWVVQPGGYYATDLHIEPDGSAATYLWAAEALTAAPSTLESPRGALPSPMLAHMT